MSTESIIYLIAVAVVPIIFAITLHEVAHGWVANLLGDSTAKMMGRLSVNPLKHIDLVGTVLVPAILIYAGGFIFGWAKPVPVNWNNLRNPQRDMSLVAIAGPFSNLLMCLFWGLVWKVILVSFEPSNIAIGFVHMAKVGVQIHLLLMLLNILPIPPLDGSRVLGSFLSIRLCILMHRYEGFGFIILVMLIFSGVLMTILQPMYIYCYKALITLYQI